MDKPHTAAAEQLSEHTQKILAGASRSTNQDFFMSDCLFFVVFFDNRGTTGAHPLIDL
ncbi:hypothetical protein J2S62_002444 [Enteractinococcus fodinae]|uniref:Uncharacterized protein n=1 Tax=Enteractinococcus fodinae TaxID=684663 RepID=A0ABU2B3L6_9MICC|nr:hypothetical protein [Enteractinococcus fodinae]